MVGDGTLRRRGIEVKYRAPIVEGDNARDWSINGPEVSLWPYDSNSLRAESSVPAEKLLWPYKRSLSERVAYGSTQLERGLQWFEYSMFFAKRFKVPLSITFAFVATHNHFVLDRGGKVFKQTAPIIKLSQGARVDEHLALLGVLHSSTACFWRTPVAWENFYEFTSTTLQDYPLPSALPLERARLLDSLAQELSAREPSAICAHGVPSQNTLTSAKKESEEIRARMVAVQEELDWEVYGLYGLIDVDLTYGVDDLPGLALGERTFEIVLAKSGEETSWFERHESKAITEIPAHWPTAYRELVQSRLHLIAEDPRIRLLEKPEYKRRWSQECWDKRQERALRGWLLDRLEDRRFWFDSAGGAEPKSVGQVADEVTRDADMVAVLALWEGRPDVPVTDSLVRLLEDEAVPYLAAHRYKDSGLRKRESWEETWDLQRCEDRGEQVGTISVPPKYTSADFLKTPYWRARGRLDVPKERFILYPDAGREGDSTPLLGWAGWDHAQQSLALARIIGEREQEGWDDERLVPLVAGLAELQPWVSQWHSEVDPVYGVSLAAFCQQQLDQRAAQVGKTLAELAAWRPAPVGRGRRSRSKGGAG